MEQPPKTQPDDDDVQAVTQYYNFPGPWVRDYDPKKHGYRPEAHFQQPGQGQPQNQPGGISQQPVSVQSKLPPIYPPEKQIYLQQSQAQWNPAGVYGGLTEQKKNSLPWWGWLLLILGLLIILGFIGYATGIYRVF